MATLYHAEQAANDIRELLAPEATLVVAAGSVRRQRPEVRDLEIVCVPKRGGRPVWGEPLTAAGGFEALIGRLVRTNQLTFDPSLKRNGAKYKRLVYTRGAVRLPVDLFIADPSGENFGNLLAIRTGDAEFSRLLVTPRPKGGFMPDDMWQRDGYLWQAADTERGERVPCPTEEAFFARLGLPLVAPTERNMETAARLRRERVSA